MTGVVGVVVSLLPLAAACPSGRRVGCDSPSASLFICCNISLGTQLFGAVEAGGTKIVCAVGTGPADVTTTSFPTTAPAETIQRVISFFRDAAPDGLTAVGIGSFGPVELDPASPAWGHITTTPKPDWSDCPLAPAIRDTLGVPVAFDTDVNAALAGEHRWGAARGVNDAVYITVGTGIGGGAMAGGRIIHGLLHPEMGHLRLPLHPEDTFAGRCPYHGACLEGLASGPAIAERWGLPGDRLPEAHAAWDLQAHYLGTAIAGIVCTLSPKKVILGGGVMHQTHLYPKVRAALVAALNGYVRSETILSGAHDYVVPPALGDRAGVLGALALATTLRPS